MRNQTFLLFLGLIVLQATMGFKVNNKEQELSFNKNFLDAEIVDVIWCGDTTENDKNVLVQTDNGTIYRSTNKMVHFENIEETLIREGVKHLGDYKSEVSGEIVKMVRSTANPNYIILQGKDAVNWITKDCGNSFRAFTKKKEKQVSKILFDIYYYQFYKVAVFPNTISFYLKNRINILKLHPTQENWMLATTQNACPQSTRSTPCFSFSILWLSEDLGLSWQKLTQYVYKFEWGSFNYTEKAQIPPQRIYWVQEDGNKQNQNRYGLQETRNLYYSDDFMVTKKKILEKGNVFYLDQSYLYAVELENQNTQLINLKVGDPKQKEIKLRDVQLGEKLSNHRFTILDTKEGQVFINVNHLGKYSPMGTLYISDATGTRFSTSLQGHLRSESGDTDFERLHGIYGIFISNVYDEKRRQEFENTYSRQSEEDNQDVDTKNKKSNTSVKQDKKETKLKELITQRVQTMITFDKGGIWQRIPAPKVDHNNKEIKCGENCFLNIHSNSNDLFNSFYSSKNAVGIVLANGNVGKYLSHSPSQVNTYLSRDAGYSWTQIKKGAYVFEIGDHGSIIVMGKDRDYGTTKSIEYSLDEGLTWKEIQISDIELEIDNILTEPSNVGTTFMILAKTVASDEKKKIGMAITIDFANQFERACVGAPNPGDEFSDYEKWVPHSYSSSKCLLGTTLTFTRKKRESICINGENFDRVIDLKVCECSEEDWECDYGYTRKQGSNYCERDGTLTDEEYYGIIPEICTDFYEVSRGYRKIPFNYCKGGVDYAPEWKRCPGNEIISLSTLKNLFIVGLAIAAIYYGNQYKSQLSAVISYLSSIIPSIISHRKDYIDFSKAKHDTDDKFMNLFSLGNKSQVNHYSNINDEDDEEDNSQNNNNRGEYNNVNQQNYFADDHDYDDENTNFDPRN